MHLHFHFPPPRRGRRRWRRAALRTRESAATAAHVDLTELRGMRDRLPIMDEWIRQWVVERFRKAAEDPTRIRVEDFGPLPLQGELVVWHPLDDVHRAPRIPFRTAPGVEAIWVGDELAGYVLRTPGDVATWGDLGDASTDTDRFFVFEVSRVERVIDWFKDERDTFEQLGGNRQVEPIDHSNGTRIVVIGSPDGNARIRAGYARSGELVCAVIDT